MLLLHQQRDHSTPDLQDQDPLDTDAIFNQAILKVVCVAGIGSLLFGIDTAGISGVLLVIGDDLGGSLLSNHEQELVVSSALVGALVGSLGAGRLGDWWGRKKSIILAGVLFALGALVQAAAQILRELVVGRFMVGLGVGVASSVLPIYLAELSPRAFRGRIVGSLVALITFGQVLAYVVDALFFSIPAGWRYMCAFGAIPAIIQLVLSFSIPESPRYSISRGRVADARATLRLIYPLAFEGDIQKRVERIQGELELQRSLSELDSTKRSLVEALFKVKPNRRALLLAMGLQFFQQGVGGNSLLYYSGRILERAQFSNPLNFALGIAMANFFCTLVALRLIDFSGRRQILLYSIPGMVAGQFLTGLAFLFIPAVEVTSNPSPGLWAYMALFSMVLFICSYAVGLGVAPWVVQSEIFSDELRSLGSGFSTATNWLTNLAVASSFLSLSRAITPTGAFWLYAIIAVLAWVFTFLYLPETKGLDLDATKALFESDVWAYELDRTGSRGVEGGGGSYTAVGRTSSEEPGEERGRRAEGEDAEIG